MTLTAQETYQKLLGRGLSPIAAAGVAGNLKAESGFNPLAYNNAGGGAGALGLFQWRGGDNGGRQNNLKNFASLSDRSFNDADTQLDFFIHELANSPGDAGITLDELNAFTDPVKAGEAFRERYLRPGPDPNGYATTRRTAADVYNQFSGLEPIMATRERDPSKPNLTFGLDTAAMADETAQLAMTKYGGDQRYTQLLMQGLIPGHYNSALMSMGELAPPPTPAGRNAPTVTASTAGAPVEDPAVAPVANPVPAGQPNEGKKGGILDWLAPVRQGEAANTPFTQRQGFSDMLTALSTSLGQLDTGQAVNVGPAVNDLRRVRQERVDAAARQDLAQQQIDINAAQYQQDSAISQQNADTASSNAYIAQQQFIAEQQAAVAANQPLAPEVLAAVSAIPQLAPLAQAYSAAPTPAVGKQLLDLYSDVVKQQTTTGSADAPLSGAAQSTYLAGSAEGADPVQTNLALANLTPAESARVQGMLDDTRKVKEATAKGGELPPDLRAAGEILRLDNLKPAAEQEFGGDLLKAQMRLKKIELDPDLVQEQRKQATEDASRKDSGARINDILARRKSDQAIMASVSQAENALTRVAAANGKGGVLETLYANYSRSATSVFGQEAKTALDNALGVDPEAVNNLATEQQMLALLIGKALTAGTGSITDPERAAISQAILSGNMTVGETAAALAKIRGGVTFDRIADDHFIGLTQANSGEGATNYLNNVLDTERTINRYRDQVVTSYTRANVLSTAIDANESFDKFPQYKTFLDVITDTSPQLDSLDDALRFRDFMVLDLELPDAEKGGKSAVNVYYNTTDGLYYGVREDGTQMEIDEATLDQPLQ